MSDILTLVRQRLSSLDPVSLVLDDDSHLHQGHAGARAGGGHYRLRIISAQFDGMGRIARHRLVYQTLNDLMQTRIHALNIEALTPEES
jgi:BolA protein